jgi:hypothetical protein
MLSFIGQPKFVWVLQKDRHFFVSTLPSRGNVQVGRQSLILDSFSTQIRYNVSSILSVFRRATTEFGANPFYNSQYAIGTLVAAFRTIGI